MATASVTNTFVQDATTAAADMNQNFTDVETFMNASVVHLDGSKSMTGDLDMDGFKLTGVSLPSASTDAVTKAYVDSVVGGATISATVPYTGSSGVDIVFSSSTGDVDGWFDIDTSTTQLVCPADGLYKIRTEFAYAYNVASNYVSLYYQAGGVGSFVAMIPPAPRYLIEASRYIYSSTVYHVGSAGDVFTVRPGVGATIYTANVYITKLADV